MLIGGQVKGPQFEESTGRYVRSNRKFCFPSVLHRETLVDSLQDLLDRQIIRRRCGPGIAERHKLNISRFKWRIGLFGRHPATHDHIGTGENGTIGPYAGVARRREKDGVDARVALDRPNEPGITKAKQWRRTSESSMSMSLQKR